MIIAHSGSALSLLILILPGGFIIPKVFATVSFERALSMFIWFFFITFFSFLYFTYYGMMTLSITPNHQAADILASAFYALFTLFSGFSILNRASPNPIII
ncbi:hypothetical protein ACOSQ2_020699 [Xanthoceras sorbifolium]